MQNDLDGYHQIWLIMLLRSVYLVITNKKQRLVIYTSGLIHIAR